MSSIPVGEMALGVAIEMEEKRKQEARVRFAEGTEEATDHDEIIYSLDEITKMNSETQKKNKQGPDLNEQNIKEVRKLFYSMACYDDIVRTF